MNDNFFVYYAKLVAKGSSELHIICGDKDLFFVNNYA